MEPKDCPECDWTSIGHEPDGNPVGHYVVHCAKFKRALGWTHGHGNAFCKKCITAGWHKLKALDVPELRAHIQRLLAGRFHNGDCPKWKGTGEHELDIDLSDWLHRYLDITSFDDAAHLFERSILNWAKLPEVQGGHPPETVAAIAEAIAAEFGMEHVLALVEAKVNELVGSRKEGTGGS